MRGMFSVVRNSGSLKGLGIALVIASLGSATSFAGPANTSDTKESPIVEVPTMAVVRESRGLVTSEGPSGMFINPTTATLTQGTWAFGYCSVLTNQDTDILGNHMFISYGARLARARCGRSHAQRDHRRPGATQGRLRHRRTDGPSPLAPRRRQLARNKYRRLCDDGDRRVGFQERLPRWVSKTVPIDEKGFVKTVTFQGGFRESWIEAPDRNTNRFYGGVEVQLPHNIYLIGEVTQFSHRKDEFTPWAAGIQWRGRRFGLTAAIVQSGDDDPPSIYLGIGGGLGAEPVRTPTRPTSRP